MSKELLMKDKETRKERYEQLLGDSAIVWHKLYEEEKAKREEIEEKYKLLVNKIKKDALKDVDNGDDYLRNYARDWKRL